MSGIYLPSFAEVSAVAASRGQDSAAPDQWRGLVGMWRPSAGIQGDRLIDWSGNANHGTLENMDPATDWVSGRHGWALDFDGGNDYVDAGPGPFDIIEGTSKATLMLWCRRAVTSDYVNIGNRKPGAPVTDGLIINGWTDGKFYLTVSNGSAQFGSFTSNDTNWHHIVLRFDGTESTNDARLKGYLDGIQQTLTYNDTIPATISSALPNLFIGRDEAVTAAYTNGLIDDGRLYSRALTASEIQSIYRDPTAVVRWAPRRRYWYLKSTALKVYSRGDESSLPTGITDLENSFTSQEYTDVDTDDATRVTQTADGGQYAIFLFKDVNPNSANEQFTVDWNGQSSLAPSTSAVKLQVYNRNSATWEDLDTDNTAGADTDFDLSGTVSTSLSDYYDANYQVVGRVYQQDA